LAVVFLFGAAFLGADFLGADFAAVVFFFALVLVFALPRAAAGFDAVDDFRRALPPDDFDAGAMIYSSRKVQDVAERKIRAQCRERLFDANATRFRRVSQALANSLGIIAARAESAPRGGMQPPPQNCAGNRITRAT
jgi:hypothetical protein